MVHPKEEISGESEEVDSTARTEEVPTKTLLTIQEFPTTIFQEKR